MLKRSTRPPGRIAAITPSVIPQVAASSIAESARSPTISATGSPGTTLRSKNSTTRTPNSVGIVATSRLVTSCNTDLGPTLAVENDRNVPAFDGGVLGPEIDGEPEVQPRRGVEHALVDAAIQRLPRRLR